MARRNRHFESTYPRDEIIYRVIVDIKYIQEVRYSFVLLRNSERILAYDNYEGKGNHRHYLGKEEKMSDYLTIEEIWIIFNTEVRELIWK